LNQTLVTFEISFDPEKVLYSSKDLVIIALNVLTAHNISALLNYLDDIQIKWLITILLIKKKRAGFSSPFYFLNLNCSTRHYSFVGFPANAERNKIESKL
jgi:hypothetical protein